LDILEAANKMLKPGGQLVYSTCTFAPEENEQTINEFFKKHPEFTLEEVPLHEHFQGGRPEWVSEPASELEKTVRIWPHHVSGEGHFIAILRKSDTAISNNKRLPNLRPVKNKKRLANFTKFAEESLSNIPKGNLVFFGDELYIAPEEMVSFDGLKVVRAGWHLGTEKKNRFEPSHSLALSLSKDDVKYSWDLTYDSKDILAYLKGETFSATGENGWYLMTVNGYSIGWGKLANQIMKNHYPKGLRWV